MRALEATVALVELVFVDGAGEWLSSISWPRF
jgi:hypothetical protein